MIGLKVGFSWFEIGSIDFLKSFFSTIEYNLENSIRGSKYPVIMKELFNGEVKVDRVNLAYREIIEIKSKLSLIDPKLVVWDIYDLKKQPPWGNEISTEISSLANYFVTCNGEDLFDIIELAIENAKDEQTSVKIEVL